MSQEPRIVRSDLTKPPRWYVLTRYREKRGVNMDGDDVSYLVATTKFDVTDQMDEILKHYRKPRRRAGVVPEVKS
jgi:hypothetical protein